MLINTRSITHTYTKEGNATLRIFKLANNVMRRV